MNVTNVKIQKIYEDDDKFLKALCSVTVDNALAIHDIRLIKTDDKMFIAMPNKLIDTGVYKDVVHPINSQTRDELTEAVISAYLKYMESKQLEINN